MMQWAGETTNKMERNSSDFPSDQVLVHRGFQRHYLTIQHDVLKCITDLNAKFVYIFGHSLGGGIANLLLYDLLDRDLFPASRIHVVTIGGPRVGNPAFCKSIAAYGATIIRLNNTADVFCSVPLSSMPSLGKNSQLTTYQHAGKGYMFNAIGVNLIHSHSVPMYTAAIERGVFTEYCE
jgi:predicted lipase